VRPRRARLGRLRHRTKAGAVNAAGPTLVNGANGTAVTAPRHSAWRRWSEIVQARPWPLAIVSLAVMVLLMVPVFAIRLDSSDAGNDPASVSSRHAFDLLAQGFGAGFNGPLQLVAELSGRDQTTALASLRAAVSSSPDVVAVTQPRIAPSGTLAVIQAYPDSAPQP
jgi:RND superfamily putative drug exporter